MKTKYSFTRLISIYMAWWLVWALLQTIVLHRLGLDWNSALIDSFISNALLAFICFNAIAIYYYYQPGKGSRSYRVIFAFALGILYSISVKWVLKTIFANDPEYLDFLVKSQPVRLVLGILILSFVTLLVWMWNNLQEQKEKDQRRNDMEQLAKDAELARLRQQLQPHFLFNSLNSISALAGSKPSEARKMIQQLSDFLRGTLRKDEQQIVPLNEEIEHLKLYLEIEKVRFGHRLQIDMNFSEESLMYKIPPLLMQPIVENAIKFGLYDSTEEITIAISSQVKENNLLVVVQNPFDADTQMANQGTGFGLSSIQRRLFLLYSRNDLLVTEKKDGQFFTTLRIPQTL